MTEYKRMVANLAEIELINNRLRITTWVDDNLSEAKQILDKAQDDLVPLTSTRLEKMVAKAREKDPERQIYNEATCAKIEELALAAEGVFATTASVAPYVEATYLDDLRRRVASEQYLSQLVDSTSVLGSRESDARVMLKLEESHAWRALSAIKATDYEESLARFRAREAAELRCEMERRTVERQAMQLVAAQAQLDGGQALVEALKAVDVRGDIRGHLIDLSNMLNSDPSYVGVRKLRNSNATLMEQFGHPFAVSTPESPPESAKSAVARYVAVEALLAAVGYRPEYTVVDFGRPATMGEWYVDWPSLPWAKFGERMLVLDEPVPDRDPDAWMLWHESLAAISSRLSKTRW